MVALSVPEAFRLSREVASLPRDVRSQVRGAFDRAARRIISAERPQLSGNCDDGPANHAAIARWYESLELDCPLLRDGACMLYAARPTGCRTFLVTSPPRCCRPPEMKDGRRIPMPISLTEALVQLSAEVEHVPPQAVLLPLVPLWCRANMRRDARTWPAETLVTRFAEIVEQMASQWSGCRAS